MRQNKGIYEKIWSLPNSFSGACFKGRDTGSEKSFLVIVPKLLIWDKQKMADSISDFFIRIKNAYMVKKDRVFIPFSKIKFNIAKILENKGFILSVGKKKKRVKKTDLSYLDIKLKYNKGVPAFEDIKLISTPGRRIYVKKDEIKPVKSGYGISIISTSKGIMTGEEAKKKGIGGQIIAEVW